MVAERNGATGVLVITDGDFSPEARLFAADHSLVLVDGEALLDLVLELTLGNAAERRLGTRVARLLSNAKPRTRSLLN